MDDGSPPASSQRLVPAGRALWDTSCKDWEQRLLAGTSLVPDLPLFEAEVARAVRIFNRLRIPDVIGTPTMQEAAGAWIYPLVAAIFGSYDPALNIRMIQEFFLLIPKKNGKSSYSAAIMVVALIMNRRPQAEYLLIAPTIEIATIALKQAAGTIRADPELEKLFKITDHQRLIQHRVTGAVLKIKAADADVITGGKQLGTLIDETHVFASHHDAANVFVEVRGALAARPDGFLIQISTQSKEPPSGVFKKELDIARGVRDGRISLPLLPVIYELPRRISDNGGWKDERYWHLVNPNLGRSVAPNFLRGEIIKVEESGDKGEAALLASQHFNVEIGLALRSDRWTGAEYWPLVGDPTLTLDSLLERSEVVCVGIDGGGLDDLLAIGVMGRERDTKRWLYWSRAYAHEIVLERRKEDAPVFRDFENTKEKDLVILKSVTDGVKAIADIIERIQNEGLLAEKEAIGVDTQIVGQIVDEIVGRGIAKERINGIPQNWQLTAAINTSAVMVYEGKLVHAAQPVMTWSVGNVKIEPRGNAVTVTKQVSGRAKIDNFIAMMNCVVLMSKNPTPGDTPSVYDLIARKPATDSVPVETIDYRILNDPRHPDWEIHRRRWEKKHLSASDDD